MQPRFQPKELKSKLQGVTEWLSKLIVKEAQQQLSESETHKPLLSELSSQPLGPGLSDKLFHETPKYPSNGKTVLCGIQYPFQIQI